MNSVTIETAQKHHTAKCRAYPYGCECGFEWFARPGAILALDEDYNVAIRVDEKPDGSAHWEGTIQYLVRHPHPNDPHNEQSFVTTTEYRQKSGVEPTFDLAFQVAMDWYDAEYVAIMEP